MDLHARVPQLKADVVKKAIYDQSEGKIRYVLNLAKQSQKPEQRRCTECLGAG